MDNYPNYPIRIRRIAEKARIMKYEQRSQWQDGWRNDDNIAWIYKETQHHVCKQLAHDFAREIFEKAYSTRREQEKQNMISLMRSQSIMKSQAGNFNAN